MVEESRLEAASLLAHESFWSNKKQIASSRRKYLLSKGVVNTEEQPETSSVLQVACEDVRVCLCSDIRTMQALILTAVWPLKSSPVPSPTVATTTTDTVAAATSVGRVQSESELALLHLMYKIADARALVNCRIDLASGRPGCPPPLVLDLWCDVISAGIASVTVARNACNLPGSCLYTPASSVYLAVAWVGFCL